MKFSIIKKHKLVFKHWTRNSYAIFFSINKVVKIARLNIKLSENFGNKFQCNSSFYTLNIVENLTIIESDDEYNEIIISNLLSELKNIIQNNKNISFQFYLIKKLLISKNLPP